MTDRHYPATRLRRLRSQPFLRDLVREHRLSPADLILPVFIREGQGIREPVASMPGVVRQSLDQLVITAREAADAGLPALVLFPLIEAAHKSEDAAAAWDPDGLVPSAIQAIKAQSLKQKKLKYHACTKDINLSSRIIEIVFCKNLMTRLSEQTRQ